MSDEDEPALRSAVVAAIHRARRWSNATADEIADEVLSVVAARAEALAQEWEEKADESRRGARIAAGDGFWSVGERYDLRAVLFEEVASSLRRLVADSQRLVPLENTE